jgi:hypothetical protein
MKKYETVRSRNVINPVYRDLKPNGKIDRVPKLIATSCINRKIQKYTKCHLDLSDAFGSIANATSIPIEKSKIFHKK